MQNTSMGFHTFAFFQRAREDEFSSFTSDFMESSNKNSDMIRFPIKDKKGRQEGWGYTYKKNKGIRWLLISTEVKNGFTIQGVLVIINPKALIEDNYIRAAQADDLKIVEELYNDEATKISPLLLKFGQCSLNRADPCLNVDLKELGIPCTPEQMMSLIKQGNIPKHYEERKEKYNEKQHRKITDEHSFYLESKSSVINYYWKYPKQEDEKHPNFLFREASRYVIRLEVECKYSKLYPLAKDIKHTSRFYVSDDISNEELYERLIHDVRNPSIPIDVILSDEVSADTIQKHFYRVIRKGDYFTLDDARSIVESYNFRREKKERIIYALEQIRECRGIAKAKSKLHGPDLHDFNRSLKDLDNMLINPVTIPRRWKIRHIPNLLHTYYDAVYEEQIIFKQEYLARKHIDEILSEEL